MSDTDPGKPVQVVMPAALLPRLVEPLAMLGMRLYQLPTVGEPTLMIAADMSQFHDPDRPPALTTAYVLEAWSYAAESLAEAAQDPLRRPRKPRRSRTREQAGDGRG